MILVYFQLWFWRPNSSYLFYLCVLDLGKTNGQSWRILGAWNPGSTYWSIWIYQYKYSQSLEIRNKLSNFIVLYPKWTYHSPVYTDTHFACIKVIKPLHFPHEKLRLHKVVHQVGIKLSYLDAFSRIFHKIPDFMSTYRLAEHKAWQGNFHKTRSQLKWRFNWH